MLRDKYNPPSRFSLSGLEPIETVKTYKTLADIDPNERILKELLHRVKNDLQLIRSFLSIQASRTPNVEIRSVLEEAGTRIDAIGNVYETIFRQSPIGSAELDRVLTRLFQTIRLKSGITDEQLVLHATDTVVVPTKVSIAISLILNELITNSYKYSGRDPETLTMRVSLSRTGDRSIRLTFRDNGTGFPREVIEETHGGFGLETVSVLVDQYDGTVTFRNDNGAVVDSALPV